ncbi:MAG TPA: hypothetical protein VJ821_14475 [Anaerolineales bacterium]|nr:hypothetical protein [Anaerolineales bacterium]
MKTNFWPHPSMRSLTLLSVLIALLVSAFSVSGVSAARTVPMAELESTWDRQLDRLFVHGFFFDNVRLYPADFEDLDDLEQAYFYLDKFRIALRGAQTLVATHPGFDFEGSVTNQFEATQTVRSMANYLWVMRGMHNKLVEMDAIP